MKPKPCDARFGDPATSSGFPGLLAKEIELNNNDVEGETSGNVLCTDCRTDVSPREAIGAKRKGIVDGNIYTALLILSPNVSKQFKTNQKS